VKIKDTPKPMSRANDRQQDPVLGALVNQAMSGGNIDSWKDIKPAKTYQDIKKQAFIH